MRERNFFKKKKNCLFLLFLTVFDRYVTVFDRNVNDFDHLNVFDQSGRSESFKKYTYNRP
jgi:hypothetical protein